MPSKFPVFLPVLLLLSLSALLSAQDVPFIPAAELRQREAELNALADKLLATTDTHERIAIRDKMLELDTLREQNGFAIPAFVRIYQEGLRRNDINARLQAAVGLSSINHPKMVDAVTTMLSDPSIPIRLRVLKGIHDNGIIRAWKLVLPQLNDPNIEIQTWAARTLGKLAQGAEGEASLPLIELLVKTWDQLQKTQHTDEARRSSLNALIETAGTSLGQLTQLPWRPAPDTKDLGAAIAVYTNWWNQKQLPSLKDPRIGERKKALEAVTFSADRSAVTLLVEFMAQEHLRWQQANDPDAKRQSLALLVKANDILKRVSGKDVQLSDRADDAQIVTTIKSWTTWWQDESKRPRCLERLCHPPPLMPLRPP